MKTRIAEAKFEKCSSLPSVKIEKGQLEVPQFFWQRFIFFAGSFCEYAKM